MHRLRSALIDFSNRLGPSGPLDRVSYLLLAAFVMVTLGKALLGLGALVDVDFLTLFLPFRAIDGRSDGGFITLRQDTTDYYLPAIAVIKQAFLAGEFPTWAPYEVGGAPLASLPNHAALSPLSLPYFLLPLWLAPAFVKLGEFVVAIAGMVAFLGRHGVSRGAGVVAGILFATSGFMMMWTNWPHTRVASFIPLLFWALERLNQERRARDVVPVAAVVACMLLGGFPAVTIFTLTIAAAYVLARAWWRYRADAMAMLRVLGQSAGGVLLGVGLAAVQIVPFIRNLDQLGLENRNFDGRHLPFALLVTIVAPDAVGLSVNGSEPRWYGPVNAIEAVGFVGAVAVVLAVAALVTSQPPRAAPERSPRWFLAGAAAVAATAIYVGGPVLAALQYLPFYSTNFIGRASSVFGFLVAALAGIGLERVLRWVEYRRGCAPDGRGEEREPRSGAAVIGKLLLPTVLLSSVGLLGIAVLKAAADYAAAAGQTAHLVSTLVLPTLLLIGALAGVVLIRVGPGLLRPALGAIAALVALLAVAQSAAFAHTMLPLNDRSNVFPLTPTHSFLQAHIAESRYGSALGVMYPASSDFYRLRTPVGHEFTTDRWKDLLRAVDHRSVVTRTGSRFSNDLSLAETGKSAVLDQLAVSYWVASPEDVAGRADEIPDDEPTIEVGPDERMQCEVDGADLRGVEIKVADPRDLPPHGRPLLHVAVHTPDGTLTGERLLGSLGAGPQRVAVMGEDLPRGGRFRVEVWFTGLDGNTVVRTRDGELACAAVRPQDDGLRLVFAEAGATVYERLRSLPRIRWASRSELVMDPAARITALTESLPDDTVLLEDPKGPTAEDGAAAVGVVEDSPERIAVQVDAERGGYLVVADALVRDGWTATVDGREVRLVHGNHAFAAVWVPAGEHRIELAYTAPGLRSGVIVSILSMAVAGLLLLLPGPSRPRRAALPVGWPAP
jgi:Bacterial membrane protein YfhO